MIKYIWAILCLLSVNVTAQEVVSDGFSFEKMELFLLMLRIKIWKCWGLKKMFLIS